MANTSQSGAYWAVFVPWPSAFGGQLTANGPETAEATCCFPIAGLWRDPLRDILAGTVAGIVGRFLEYPFDTVKVKLQAASIGTRDPAKCVHLSINKILAHQYLQAVNRIMRAHWTALSRHFARKV